MQKKILFIHHGVGIGGASLSLLYLVQSLDKQKFMPVVLFMQNSAAVKMFAEAGIKIVGPIHRSDFSHTKIWWYRWYHPHHLFKAAWDSLVLWAGLAKKHLKQINPDLVHLNTSSLWAWASTAYNLNIPVIWHIREPLSDGYFGLRRRLTVWAVARWASKIVAICKDNALPWHKNPKTMVLYNAVPNKFVGQTSPPTRPIILFLGGLSQEKGTLWLMQSFKKLLQKLPEAKLLIAGNWEPKFGLWQTNVPITPWHRYCQQVTRLLHELGSAVEILGVTTEVPKLLSQASLLVFPALTGHFARPVIEAGFCGIPVVASNLSPMTELVKDGQTGILVPPGDANALAEAMRQVLTNNVLAATFGAAATNFCRQKFNLQTQAKKFAKLLNQL